MQTCQVATKPRNFIYSMEIIFKGMSKLIDKWNYYFSNFLRLFTTASDLLLLLLYNSLLHMDVQLSINVNFHVDNMNTQQMSACLNINYGKPQTDQEHQQNYNENDNKQKQPVAQILKNEVDHSVRQIATIPSNFIQQSQVTIQNLPCIMLLKHLRKGSVCRVQ